MNKVKSLLKARWMSSLIFLLLLFLLPSPALAEGENLLVNGSVDDVSAAGFPTGWEKDMWFTGEDVSLLSVEGGGV